MRWLSLSLCCLIFIEASSFTTIAPDRIRMATYATNINALAIASLVNTHLDHIRFFARIDPYPTGTKNNFESAWSTCMFAFSRDYAINKLPTRYDSGNSVLAGWDYRTPTPNVIGIVGGYLNSYYHETDQADQGHVNSGILALYGNLSFLDCYLESALWGLFEYTLNKRQIRTDTVRATAKAPIQTWQFEPHAEFGYNIHRSWGRITPFLALDYPISWQGSYTETGAYPYNAHQNPYFFSTLHSEFGFKFHQFWTYNWGYFLLKQKFASVLDQPFFGSAKLYVPENDNKIYYLDSDTRLVPLFKLGFDISAIIGKRNPWGLRLSYLGEAGRARLINKFQFLVDKIF